MKQFDLQGNEYDCTIEIPLKKATYEDIQTLNINLQTQLFVKDKEIERLNKALLDIKELVLNNARLNKEDNRCDLDLIYYKCNELLDIVNNALGVDKE